jgi:hypothetical protein
MKSYINKLFFIGALAIGLSACKKDETQAVVNTSGSSMTLSATSNTLILLQDNATQDAITFNWDKAEFGYKAAITYSIQLSKKGDNFTPATDVIVGSELSKKFTVSSINQELLKVIPYDVATDIELRIKADVGSNVTPQYSNVIQIKATAYRSLIDYSFPKALWVAGNYQGWNPGTAPKIVDKNADGQTGSNYEGYINFSDGAPHDFKLVKGNDWPAGDFGSPAPGVLTNGGGNLSIPTAPGVYLLKANTVALSWSYILIKKWAVTGNATPKGWPAGPDGTPDQDHTMNFDPVTGLYTVTLDLGAGELKFRANDAWELNFGDNGNDGVPDYGGSNIVINAAGNYTITLDIMVAGNYAYTVKKN